MKHNALIIGGTSGLGLELARSMHERDESVIVTGRHDPKVEFASFLELDLSGGSLPERIGAFVADLPSVKTLVYNAGFFQEGHVTDLSDQEIDRMVDVGGRGLIFLTKKLLEKQGKLDELITVTSTSQWVPREFEPVYNFVKAGAAHYSHGLSLDPRLSKTIVAGPSGMATEFWTGTDRDTSTMMPPAWVAEQIIDLRHDASNYTFARILGANGDLSNRIEIVEQT